MHFGSGLNHQWKAVCSAFDAGNNINRVDSWGLNMHRK